MLQKYTGPDSECPENQWKCSRCGYILTDKTILRCPRCFTLLLPRCGCSGNCNECFTKHKSN